MDSAARLDLSFRGGVTLLKVRKSVSTVTAFAARCVLRAPRPRYHVDKSTIKFGFLVGFVIAKRFDGETEKSELFKAGCLTSRVAPAVLVSGGRFAM